MKKVLLIILSVLIALSVMGISAFAETEKNTDFTFDNGKMSEEVLGNYLSRAVSFQGLCLEGLSRDAMFDDDLRMIKNIGAKFIGRTCFYSWSGNMNSEQIESHFTQAKELAAKAHKVDDELILQAGVFEIMFEGTVNSTAIPDWVFEEFGLASENRNFNFEKMLPPASSKYGRGYWDNKQDAAVPYIGNVETQMYFYYLVTRYIDAGYEAVHLGQVDLMMNNNLSLLSKWDEVVTKGREYAKTHARRGICLFDAHREITSVHKIGNRLVFDYLAAGLCPQETEIKNDAEQAELLSSDEKYLSWIGRAVGGEHPLGFTQEVAFSIFELDNFGGSNGSPHVKVTNDVSVWGYDHITWFAIQPEWYRNQFLRECDEYFSTHQLNSAGKQTSFMQMPCRRVICPEQADRPVLTFKADKDTNLEAVMNLLSSENMIYDFDIKNNSFSTTLKENQFYRANSRSASCPYGFNQEETIKRIFLGATEEQNQNSIGTVTDKSDDFVSNGLSDADNKSNSVSDNQLQNTDTGNNNAAMLWIWIAGGVVFIAGAGILAYFIVAEIKKSKNKNSDVDM